MTREKDKLIDENEQLQQTNDMLVVNYEKEKQVLTFSQITTLFYITGKLDNEGNINLML